jgi:hypothetical protein
MVDACDPAANLTVLSGDIDSNTPMPSVPKSMRRQDIVDTNSNPMEVAIAQGDSLPHVGRRSTLGTRADRNR